MAPIYTPEDYYQILTGIIREDQQVPFSCFLLLTSNQRVVCLVQKNEPFDSARLAKPGRTYRVLQPDVDRIQKCVEELDKPGPSTRAPDLDDSLLRLQQLVAPPAASTEVREKVESQN